jgi:predicted ATP-grasp superfamily ATP-dependent carboligase
MKNERKSIGIVVVGDHVQALGIIRSLGRRNIPVYLLNDKNLCIGRFSRYIKKFVKTPSIENELKFLNFLLTFTKIYNLNNWILIPTNDAIVKIVSKNKDLLKEYYQVPTPSWDVVKFALEKNLTYLIAQKAEVPSSKTFCPNSISDIEKLESINIQYPVILKGVDGFNFYKKTGVKAFKANSIDELRKIKNDILHLVNPSEIVIQEMIPGNTDLVYSFCSFFKNGEAIGVWTGRKIREHPMGLGTGTFAESIYVPEIIELGSKLLSAMNYYGISEIEFKKDPRDGNFKLIEMNARTWLWISLAVRAGVDFPYMLYKDMVGEDVSSVRHFRENVKWVHLYTDLGVMAKEVLRGKMQVKEYLLSLKGEKEFAVLSLDDPLPFIAETLMLLYLWKVR